MKALGILAGPRKGQITDHLLDEVLRGLKDKGHEVKKIYLYDLKINPCLNCRACKDTQVCIINDDFKKVADELINSDVVAFASPVFVSNVTSVAKAFFDRGVSIFKMTNFGPKWLHPKPKKVILITACFAPFPFSHILGIVPGCVNAMKTFFSLMKARIRVIASTGKWNFDAKKCKGILAKAYRLGLSI
ncbi:MAG: flavodoxin family protein [Candidatus Omnitrophica bacterium]|nr:flavodoxin family protein [Candidatus Omnitrophota bacterium]MDD5592770.1 flavodoxin family protein [Candidatus Omnitrophota bacterium]